MHRSTLPAAVAYPLQALCYVAFCAVVGYFSSAPTYVHLQPGDALLKVSLQHAGERMQPCRERTAEELAKLAPNMRSAAVCPRERAPVRVDVALDDKPLLVATEPPRGLASDGASVLYRRAVIPAGAHRLRALLVDTPGPSTGWTLDRTVDVAAGRVLVLDFDAKAGGWILHP
jgi:hypothetical protein